MGSSTSTCCRYRHCYIAIPISIHAIRFFSYILFISWRLAQIFCKNPANALLQLPPRLESGDLITCSRLLPASGVLLFVKQQPNTFRHSLESAAYIQYPDFTSGCCTNPPAELYCCPYSRRVTFRSLNIFFSCLVGTMHYDFSETHLGWNRKAKAIQLSESRRSTN